MTERSFSPANVSEPDALHVLMPVLVPVLVLGPVLFFKRLSVPEPWVVPLRADVAVAVPVSVA